MYKIIVLVLILSFSISCYIKQQETPVNDNINYEELYQNTQIDRKPHSSRYGSLYQDDSVLSNLAVEHKARNINDIITVLITESSSASNRAITTSQKDSSYDMGVTNLFGLENNDLGFNPSTSVGAGAQSSFSGTGETRREGEVRSTVTARVVQKFPNGNLLIQGSREIIINHERQMIYISGIIRPRDISRNNTVYSRNISDMQLSYSGKGIVSENQRPGFLGRFLNYIWPF